jgi:hypothetical protein
MKEKNETTQPLKCDHCGNLVRLEITTTYWQGETLDVSLTDEETGEEQTLETFNGYIFELLECPTCNGILLSKYHLDTWAGKQSQREIIYPFASNMPTGLPDKIEKSYRSSLEVRNINANAFGVLIGRTLELVCNDRKAKGRFLGHKLADLAQRGEIPETLFKIAENLKELRNVGAHPSLGELTEQEVPLLDNLCRAILEYVYRAPLLVKQAQQSLEELKDKRKAGLFGPPPEFQDEKHDKENG